MNPASVDIVEMLEAESALGLTFSTNLFIGREPAKPDNCVTLFDITGQPPQLTLTDYSYYSPAVNIRVRNKDYVTGWALINDIMISLHGRNHETWNGTLYTVIRSMSDPALLNWDDNQRVRFILNLIVQRR